MTIDFDISRADALLLLKWLAALIILAAVLRAATDGLRGWSHRRWAEQQRKLDRQQDRDTEVLERDRLRAERDRHPLPGPALAGEAVRRMIYADALDRAQRPAAAAAQRGHANMLGALAQLTLAASDEPDRDVWSAELATVRQLIGAPLAPVDGFTDPPPALTGPARPPYAVEGTPAWAEAVQALAAATREHARPDDFGPGMMGRGALTSAGVYGYAAAPELDRDTVLAFMQDWMRSLHGTRRENAFAWPEAIEWPRARPEWMRDGIGPDRGMEWVTAIAELRQHFDQVVRIEDYRGLMGRPKNLIVAEVIERFGRGELDYDTIDAFASDYSLAITGQNVANTWPAGAMPDTDPSRVMPLVDELQPAEIRD